MASGGQGWGLAHCGVFGPSHGTLHQAGPDAHLSREGTDQVCAVVHWAPLSRDVLAGQVTARVRTLCEQNTRAKLGGDVTDSPGDAHGSPRAG